MTKATRTTKPASFVKRNRLVLLIHMSLFLIIFSLFISYMNTVSGTSSLAGSNSTLAIWDTSDSQIVYSNYTKFFANYTNSSGQPITGAECIWSHNSTGFWTDNQTMVYNSTSKLYELIADGSLLEGHRRGMPYGNYSWSVHCTNNEGYDNLSVQDDISVSSYPTNLTIEGVTQNPVRNQEVYFYVNYTSEKTGDIGRIIWESNDIGSDMSTVRFFDGGETGKRNYFVAGSYGKLMIFAPNLTNIKDLTEPNAYVYDLKIGDLNNDSFDDIVAIDSDAVVWVYNSSGDLQWHTDDYGGGGGSALDLGDLNGDGIEDVAYIDQSMDRVTAVLNNGTELWNQSILDLDGMGHEVLIVDLNLDGFGDVVVPTHHNGIYAFYGNNGTQMWHVDPVSNDHYIAVGAGNIDDDSNPELMLTGCTSQVFYFDNNGTYLGATSDGGGTSVETEDILVIDLNNDGYADTVRFKDGSPAYLRATLHNKSVYWDYQIPNQNIVSMRKADVDDDGDEEIISGGKAETIWVNKKDGSLVFERLISHGIIGGRSDIGWGAGTAIDYSDFNDDGINEIIVASLDGYLTILQTVACSITFNDSQSYNMTWNNTIGKWQANRTFSTAGTYNYTITCSKGGYETAVASSVITVQENDLPVVSDINITPETAYTNSTLSCYFNITDTENDNASAYIEWLKRNGTLWESLSNENIKIDDSNRGKIIYANNNITWNMTRHNDEFMCRIRVKDQYGRWTNYSNATRLISSYPTNLTIEGVTQNPVRNQEVYFYVNYTSPFGIIGEILFMTPNLGLNVMSIEAADFDCDGYRNDIIIGADGVLYAYDINGTMLWYSDEPSYAVNEIRVAAMQNDGCYDDIVIADNAGFVRVFNSSGNQVYATPDLGYATIVDVGDFDGQGIKNDFVAKSDNVNLFKSSNGADFAQNWSQATNSGNFDILATEDLDGDGIQDVATTSNPTGWIYVFSGNDGTILWRAYTVNSSANSNGHLESITALDIDHDGKRDDFAVSMCDQARWAFTWNGTYNSVYYTKDAIFHGVLGGYAFESNVIDANNNGYLDNFITNSQSTVRVFDADGNILWTRSGSTGIIYNIETGNFHDNEDEILLAGQNSVVEVVNKSGSLMYSYSFNKGSIGVSTGKNPATFARDVNRDRIDDIGIALHDGYGAVITPVQCRITFNDSSSYDMEFNYSQNIWQFSRTFQPGTYSYTINCSKPGYEPSSAQSELTVTEDTEPPQITLLYPTDSDTLYGGNPINFTYNVTENSQNVQSCSLIINGQTVSTDTSITLGTNQTFHYSLQNGSYVWTVNCTDINNHEGTGGDLNFNLINTPPNITLHYPQNNSLFYNKYYLNLNFTINDSENDSVNYMIYVSYNDPDGRYEIVYNGTNISNALYTYNLSSTVSETVPDAYTVLLFHFNNNASAGENESFVYDWSGSGNNGTCSGTGCPAFRASAGKFGGAFEFDGDNDYFTIGAHDLSPPWTAAFWIKRENSSKNNARLLDSDNYSLRLEQVYSETIGFTHYTVGDYDFGYEAPLGVWTYVVFVGNSTHTMLYLNGKFMGAIAHPISCPMDILGDDQYPVYGLMDEAVIWNRSLSAQEIWNLYKLKRGKYYWYVNATDYAYNSFSGINEFETRTNFYCSSCSECSQDIESAQSGDIITLVSDITNRNGSCIVFNGTDNITFDCNGHIISGDGEDSDYGFFLNSSFGGSDNIIIKNCPNISYFYYGIRTEYADNLLIRNISIYNSNNGVWGRGFYLRYGNNITVEDSSAHMSGTGLDIEYVANSTFRNLNLTYNELAGVKLLSDNQDQCNLFFDNTTASHGLPLFYYNNSDAIIIENISNIAGELLLCGIDNSTIRNITLDSQDGMFLINSNNNRIYGIDSSYTYGYGIYFYRSVNNTVWNSTFNSNWRSVVLSYYSDNNTLMHITSSNNTGTGIFLAYNSLGNMLINITASSNPTGIFLYSSASNNTITQSTLSNNTEYGISLLHRCNYNTINDTRITGNPVGISITSSDSYNASVSNLFYNNYFNNTVNLYVENSINQNFWNADINCSGSPNIIGGFCIGGNYWTSPAGNFSDICEDNDRNGICDSPYTPAINNTDNFPLTEKPPYVYFTYPTPENKSFSKNTYVLINITALDANDISVMLDWNRSLAGYWSFDFMNSSYVMDNSTYHRHGEIYGNKTTIPGVRGSALSFDGDGDYIIVGSGSDFWNICAQGCSFMAWVKPKSNYQHDRGGIIGRWDWNRYFFDLEATEYGQFQFYISMNGSDDSHCRAVGSDGFQYDTWMHVAGVYNGTHAIIYINGNVSDETKCNFTSINLSAWKLNETTYIGSYDDSSPFYFNGSIDEVSIFNRPLSQEEIRAAYKASVYALKTTLTNQSDNVYEYRAFAMDAAGNLNVSETRYYTIDLEPPNSQQSYPANNSYIPQNSVTLSCNVTDNHGLSNITFYLGNSTSWNNVRTYNLREIDPLLNNYGNGLILLFHFNNDSSVGENESFVYDWSGNGNNGTLINNVHIDNFGKFYKSLYIDSEGTYSYVKADESESLNITGPFTFAAWFKRGTLDDWENIITKEKSGNSEIWFGYDTSNCLELKFNGCSGSCLSSCIKHVEDNEWHFVTGIWNGSHVTAYLDGELAAGPEAESGPVDDDGSINIGDTLYWSASYGADKSYIDEVAIWNRSLSLEEIRNIYNDTKQTYGTYYNIILPDGTYTWSCLSSDIPGNRKFSSGNYTFTIDTTLPIIEYQPPTPENGEGRSFQFTVNATINETNLANVTFQFNGTNTTFNTSSSEIIYLGNSLWLFTYTQTGLQTGESYNFSLYATDLAGNQNSTETRTVIGNTAPTFPKIFYSPNDTDDMDPNVTINIAVNVSDTDNNLDTVILQWKNSSQDWLCANNVTMQNSTPKDFYTQYIASFTPTYESEFSFRIWANDTEGDINTSYETNISVFYDWTWTINRTGLPTTVAGGLGTTSYIGYFVITNTGDFNMSFSISDNSPYDPQGYSVGCGLLYNNSCSINMEYINSTPNSKSKKAFYVTATFGSTSREDAVTITVIASPQNKANPRNSTIELVLASYTGGPYLDTLITSYPDEMYHGDSYNITAVIKNIGNDSANYSWALWDIPSDFVTTGNKSYYIGTISAGEEFTSSVSLYASPSLTISGSHKININATAVNGNCTIYDNDSVTISVLCHSGDGVCGLGCTYISTSPLYDSDCLEPQATIITHNSFIGSGSSGGGYSLSETQKEMLFQTSETYEIIRSETENFTLKVENPFDANFDDINLTIQGYMKKYLRISSSHIKRLPVNKSALFTITITAPKYFTEGTYELKLVIEGFINKSVGAFKRLVHIKEERKITLVVHEISRKKAEEYIKMSEELLNKMQAAGLKTDELQAMLYEANRSIEFRTYNPALNVYETIRESYGKGMKAVQILNEVQLLIKKAQKNGIDVKKTERIAFLSMAALNRGDFSTALERANDAKMTYALETVGTFNLISFIINNWHKILASMPFIVFAIYLISSSIKLSLVNRKLKSLKKEEEVLLGLLKELQAECFEKRKLDLKEYFEATEQYEKRMNQVIKDIIKYDSIKRNIFNITKDKKKRYYEEREKLLKLVRDAQKQFMKGALDTRVYKNKMRSYAERIAEIEEKIAYIEAYRITTPLWKRILGLK